MHSSLALRQISGAPTQQAEPVRETLEQHGKGKHPDVCCRQFDGQWQPVHLIANGCHHRRGVIQARLHTLRPLAKEGHGGGWR